MKLSREERYNLKERIIEQMEALRNSARIGGLPVKLSQGLSRTHRYPFREMKVGDYFFVSNDGRSTAQTGNSLTNSCANIRKRLGYQFATFRMPRGVVVWRIA